MLRSAVLVIVLATLLAATQARAGNDYSCDIAVAPAATLLLPYFEVDFAHPASAARTTIFTVTNVSVQPRIAHIWREGVTGPSATACDLAANHQRQHPESIEIIRFDEHENTNTIGTVPWGEC